MTAPTYQPTIGAICMCGHPATSNQRCIGCAAAMCPGCADASQPSGRGACCAGGELAADPTTNPDWSTLQGALDSAPGLARAGGMPGPIIPFGPHDQEPG